MFKIKKQKYCYACNDYYKTFVCKNCIEEVTVSINRLSTICQINQMMVSRDKHIKNICILVSILTSVKISTINVKVILSILLLILI